MVRGALWPSLKNKSVVRKSYALSNLSIILGAIAGLFIYLGLIEVDREDNYPSIQ